MPHPTVDTQCEELAKRVICAASSGVATRYLVVGLHEGELRAFREYAVKAARVAGINVTANLIAYNFSADKVEVIAVTVKDENRMRGTRVDTVLLLPAVAEVAAGIRTALARKTGNSGN